MRKSDTARLRACWTADCPLPLRHTLSGDKTMARRGVCGFTTDCWWWAPFGPFHQTWDTGDYGCGCRRVIELVCVPACARRAAVGGAHCTHVPSRPTSVRSARHRHFRPSRDTKNLPGKPASREGFWVSRYRVQEHFSVSREPSGKPGSRERFEHLGMRASREAGRAYLKILGSREATGVSRDTGFSRSSARYLRMPKCEKK